MQQKNLQATAEKNSKKEAELTYLTSQDKKQLFQAIYHSSKGIHRKRDIAIFEVTLYCALRASEVSKIKISDYDPVKHTIHCHRLKGSKSNTLKL